MKTMHRGVSNSQYCTYIIRVRPLDAVDSPSVRQVYVVEEVSEHPKRMQFESAEQVVSYVQSVLCSEDNLDTSDVGNAKNLSKTGGSASPKSL